MKDQNSFLTHELTEADNKIVNKSIKMRTSLEYQFDRMIIQLHRIFNYLARVRRTNKDIKNTEGVSSKDKVAKRKLFIFYRHVHIKESNEHIFNNKMRPFWFSYESCFRNLISTIKLDELSSQVKIIILFDAKQEDFKKDFIYKYYFDDDIGLDIQFIRGGSDLKSFLITLGVVLKTSMRDSDLIYLLENDYVHQPGWVSKVFELYDSGHKFDYLSLYDHRDLYDSIIHSFFPAKLFYTKKHHWRTAPSSCASFILERHIFESDVDILGSGLSDYFFFKHLSRKRRRVLLSPVPGLSTHSMKEFLSPAVDWESILKSSC